MYPSHEASIASNKKPGFENLKFTKTLSSTPSTPPSTSSAINGVSSTSSAAQQPTQSRDATHPSRFFANPSTSYGNVLVPSSSPLSSEPVYRPYNSHNSSFEHDVAPLAAGSHSGQWGMVKPPFGMDPLSAPSGFVLNGSATNATLRRPWGGDGSDGGYTRDEGPPRKKFNRGPSIDPTDVVSSPGSPEISRLSTRRRIHSGGPDSLSLSSDESMPDISTAFAAPSRSRIVRERPGHAAHSSVDNADDPKFIQFKITNPLEDASRVRAAWDQAHGDSKRATDLLADPRWSPNQPPPQPHSDQGLLRFKMTMPGHDPARIHAAWASASGDIRKATDFVLDSSWSPPSKSPSKPLDDLGKVKEIDDANKAQRAAIREKGRKSAIYANRSSILPSKPLVLATTPPSVKVDIDLTASPLSPMIVARSKRPKRLVLDSDSDLTQSEKEDDEPVDSRYKQALDYFNKSTSDAIVELTGCTKAQAEAIVEIRPFDSVDDLNEKLGQGKKKAGSTGISSRLFEDCSRIFEGYDKVDKILEDCEKIGARLNDAIAQWGAAIKGKGKEDPGTPNEGEEGALSLHSMASIKVKGSKPLDFISDQPSLLSDTVQLKEYQLLGVNWLNLLYRNRLSCILADEMGLGKTVQVISFFAHLKEKGQKGPHLIVVPSSTLENWCREFARFAPSISVQTYYAGKEERPHLRQTLNDTQASTSDTGDGWEVLITTYNLAQGDEKDRKFFRRIEWDCCVFDEGHVLKNFQSQRYQALLRFDSRWRLLLTGTPLQNNLQELVSLMNFILPEQFTDAMGELRAIFKAKGDSKVTLLAKSRVSRAKRMMTPFVLRRRKDQVLKDLPKKTERIEWCEMSKLQKKIYMDTLKRSRKTIFDAATDSKGADDSAPTPPANGRGSKAAPKKPKAKPKPRGKDKMYLENSSNVLMDLRKAASHPMLFRTLFTDDMLSSITRQLLKEPDFKKRGALFDLVKEDMSVMTDAELQIFAATYKSTRRYVQDERCYIDSGKVVVLLKLLKGYDEEGRRVLIFSQFTQILDILQAILNQRQIKFLILTGSTPVDARQSLVDEFTEDDTIKVFLLSTKAGGMGINLTAASVVIMFDQDFNPHNDKQAQDRAYRIGQKRDVDVVKLITRGTIEEDMLKLGQTKLALDEAVAGDSDEKEETAQEREIKMSLMNVLRQQLEQQQDDGSDMDTA